MVTERLTISADALVLKAVKKLAKAEGISISKKISRLLESALEPGEELMPNRILMLEARVERLESQLKKMLR